MKKIFFCVSLALTGLMTSCVDKYEEVDADSKPSWLGSSIYAELKNPQANQKLTGTFQNYLNLIDDLGYAETLNRTGSKTIFPANDEAFERFFANNEWGVKGYADLSEAQKKLLLYSSMLDNPLLLGMLPNISNGSNEPTKGQAVKHMTNVSAIDTIQYIGSYDQMPQNNRFWTPYANKGIHVVNDGTRPMLVHLTREYMINNNISTLGDNSDFAILTGMPYDEENGAAYIYNDRVINSDIVCQNGYIHQMEDVIVPPGNMAEMLRKMDDAKLFGRMLDYFSVPVYDEDVTRNYNDWALANGREQIDSIYSFRYLSSRSQGSGDQQKENKSMNVDPITHTTISANQILNYDPAWNQFYPSVARETSLDVSIRDIGAMFVPDDDAVWGYFQPNQNGAYLIDIYGDKPNTRENLVENIDSLYAKNPQVIASFVRNLMKTSFAGTVPSKFGSVTNDASENLGLEIDKIKKTADGKYDIKIACNGVLYKMNELIAPDEYRAVLAPTSVYPDMRIMGWAVQDGVKNGDYLGVDFKYYLLAMSANYAFFIPEDAAFDYYYIDPASLGKTYQNKPRYEVLHFYPDSTNIAKRQQPYVKCERSYYDPETGEVSGTPTEVSISNVAQQMVDILNYHTLVLPEGETIGEHRYYKTKHGGEVFVDGSGVGAHVVSGEQYNNNPLFPAPQIKEDFNQKNGHSYRLDRIIQPPLKSVYGTLKDHEARFSDFIELCLGFEATDMMEWAGISSVVDKNTGMSPQDAYTIFARNYRESKDRTITNACPDYNVKMFNTYNYTLFAPNNDAMTAAYAAGLPHWSEVETLYNKYKDLPSHELTQEEQDDKDEAKRLMTLIRNFARYHFVINSVYVDKTFETDDHALTLAINSTGVADELQIGGSNDQMTVTDGTDGPGKVHYVNYSDRGTKLVNEMARDYWYTASRTAANVGIRTSSFCVVHEIDAPLCKNKNGRFDQ